MTEPVSYTLTLDHRPWTVNAERAGGERGIGGHRARAENTATWRNAFALLATEAKVPPLQSVEIQVLQVCRTKVRPDIGGCYPSFKAALDGLVDAEVIPDDSGDPYITSITFWPPTTAGYDALEITVTGIPCTEEERGERRKALEAKLAAAYLRRTRRGA